MSAGPGDGPSDGLVTVAAPIRICDTGGWTDTWFAGHGKVCNIGVYPSVDVQIALHPDDSLAERVVLDVRNFGDRYAFAPEAPPGRHPLLEATIAHLGLPNGSSAEITIASDAPAGCSTGTSAAATVALVAGLDSLTPGRLLAHQLAAVAHRIEVDVLGRQSGVQDQLCAAYGGVNYIEIDAYPHASVTQLALADPVRTLLEAGLVLLFLGRPHASSELHDLVIAELTAAGTEAPPLRRLRRCAEEARDALLAGDLAALGRAMTRNHEAQRELHPHLVCAEADAAAEVAEAAGALGWKVNGAGGDGGSLTILSRPDRRAIGRLHDALRSTDPQFEVVATRLSPGGVRVRRTRSRPGRPGAPVDGGSGLG